MKPTRVLLFDGVCNLCNGAVVFVLRRDRTKSIKFASLQSTAGRELLQQYHLPTSVFNSFVFIDDGKAYTQSVAALRLCKYLTALWPMLYGFIIVPKFIRDRIYKWIAANRYKWFGKKDECIVPRPELSARFLN